MFCRKSTYHRAKTGLSACSSELEAANLRISQLVDELTNEKQAVAGLQAQLITQQDAADMFRATSCSSEEQLKHESHAFQQELLAARERMAALLSDNKALQLSHDVMQRAVAEAEKQASTSGTAAAQLQSQLMQVQDQAAGAASRAQAQLRHGQLENESLMRKLGHLQEALVKVCSVIEEMEQLPDSSIANNASPTYNSLRRSKTFVQLLRESTAALQPGLMGLDISGTCVDQEGEDW